MGITSDPTLLGTHSTFEEYDVGTIRVSSLQPVGGLVGFETDVTLLGRGFNDYGEHGHMHLYTYAGPGQLRCL